MKTLFNGLLKLTLIFFALTVMNVEIKAQYDTTRIFKAMAKARRGENITVGVIGSSITAGSLASSEQTRWANLMADWWKNTFPQSKITFINAGIGGAKSDIGAHRVQEDLLKFNPDFIVFEYINDQTGNYTVKMMEGLVRQMLTADSLPGIMMLVLKDVNGVTPLASHKQVAVHYDIPLVSFAELIDSAVTHDGISLASIYGDGFLHPNDVGMVYIASFIKAELNKIYSVLPADSLIGPVNTTLPAPIITDTYAHTYLYTKSTIVPTNNSGWELNNDGWVAHAPDDEIAFTVDGNAISITYIQYYTANYGQTEVWVDNGSHVTLDGHFNENWGPAIRFAVIAEGLADGDHTLHIKVTGDNSSGSTGHDFQILNIYKAGNIKKAAPIANAGLNIKVLTNATVDLVGKGTDPDNSTIQSYTWSIVSKPAASVNAIVNGNNDTASFIPDVAGFYVIGLTVNDGESNSVLSQKVIHAVADNTVPVANAGNDTTVATMKFIDLNGSKSADGDNDPLFFFWRIISQPAGSNVLINNPNTDQPNFRPRIEGEYRIGLVVNDSLINSPEDEIIITAIEDYTLLKTKTLNSFGVKTYPQPAKNELTIEYNLVNSGKCEISVFDITGQKRGEYLTEHQNPGINFYNLNLMNGKYNKGLYFLVLRSGNQYFSDQFVID